MHHQTKLSQNVYVMTIKIFLNRIYSQFTNSAFSFGLVEHNMYIVSGIEERHTVIFNSSESSFFPHSVLSFLAVIY